MINNTWIEVEASSSNSSTVDPRAMPSATQEVALEWLDPLIFKEIINLMEPN